MADRESLLGGVAKRQADGLEDAAMDALSFVLEHRSREDSRRASADRLDRHSTSQQQSSRAFDAGVRPVAIGDRLRRIGARAPAHDR